MRPRLHPDMGSTVLCARVARQLTAFTYNEPWEEYVPPSYAASLSARDLPPDGFTMLRFALHSLAVYLDVGFSSSQWLSNVLEAAHYGSSFRRCFFFDYKEQRGPYPRVTNRGVQTSTKAPSARVRKGRVNA